MQLRESRYSIHLVTRLLYLVLIVSVMLEVVFFPSLANFFGCAMMAICCISFAKIIEHINYIITAPFSFFMLCSMFLFHYLPVPATLISFRPVSYGMAFPIETFILETLMFLLGCLAFLITAQYSNRTGVLKKLLGGLGFYKPFSDRVIWVLGFFGLAVRIVSLARGTASTGDIIGKMMNVLFYYMYTPVILFFPGLYCDNCQKPIDFKKGRVWLYLLIATIASLATNSRNKIIAPFCIMVLLGVLTILKCNVSIKEKLTPKKIVVTMLIVVALMSSFDAISEAMLLNRSIRENLSFTQLLSATVKTVFSADRDQQWEIYLQDWDGSAGEYSLGWTEEYVKNTWLNRFCNIRITDETLYLGKHLTNEGHSRMLKDFGNRILAVLPQPVLDVFAPTFNKELYYNARGDALYIYAGIGGSTNWGEFRVTSNLGDGIATFGFPYFPLQFVSWIVMMLFLNTFSRSVGGKIHYSLYGLLASYTSMMKFVNGNGMLDDILYFVRGYWQEVILFVCLFTVARTVSRFRIIR